MRLIDADKLQKVKFHGYPNIEITPTDVNAEAYKRGWNDAIDSIIECEPSIDAVPVKRRGVGYTGIDDDYLISIKEVIDITAETGAMETQRRIKELIPIDAVEVVRCKDCKHRYHSVECPCQSNDHFYSWMPADDWFCKKGERKEE